MLLNRRGLMIAATQAPAGAATGGAATTWNPADKDASVTLSGGNLIATVSNASWGRIRGTTSKTTGKWYFEVAIQATPTVNLVAVGIANATASLTSAPGTDGNNSRTYDANGFLEGVGTRPTTYSNGDRIGIAIDFGTGTIWFSVNNSWLDAGSPSAGDTTGSSAFTAGGAFFPTLLGGTGAGQACFTAASQTYSAPTGFTAWG